MRTGRLSSRASGILLISLSCLTPVARAQAVEDDAGEIAAFGGVSLGGGAHPTVGSSAGVGFSRYGMVLFTTSFTPMGQSTIQNWPARSSVIRSNVWDFGTDFHIRIPIGERWSPYAIAGAGLLWNTVRSNTVGPTGLETVTHYDQFNGALHTGAGLRYYIRKDWGIRPELKVVVSKHVYTQFQLGFFYVTPTNWP